MAVFLFCYFYEFDYSFLFGSKSYASLGDEGMIAAMKRMAWYLLAFGATFSFFALVQHAVSSLQNGEQERYMFIYYTAL